MTTTTMAAVEAEAEAHHLRLQEAAAHHLRRQEQAAARHLRRQEAVASATPSPV
jgi:hypothetical protein